MYNDRLQHVRGFHHLPTRQRSSTRGMWPWHVKFLRREFMESELRSVNSPDLNLVDYRTWSRNMSTGRQQSEAGDNFCLGRVQAECHWHGLDQWQARLRSCAHASGQHFEQLINWNIDCLSAEWFCFHKESFSSFHFSLSKTANLSFCKVVRRRYLGEVGNLIVLCG